MGTSPTGLRTNPTLAENDFRDYLVIVKRRKFWLILPALGILIVAAVVAWRLPDTYRCETVILVDPQKVPENYVRSATTSNIADRLSTIYEQVTSPARLKNLIDSMGLYPDLKRRLGDQEVLRIMRQSIGVEPVSSLGTQLSAFRITFKGTNAVEAAQVANQIATMFIDENLKAREQQSYGTADFLQTELDKTASELHDKENELAQLRSRYIQDLPESTQFHVQEAENLRTQLRSTEEHISRDQQEKAYLQSMMAATAPTVDLDLSNTSGRQSEIENLQTKLDLLKARYGPGHPDVRKLQADLTRLKEKEGDTTIPTEAIKAGARKTHNPVLESQIERLDQDIADQKKAVAQLQSDINFHVSKMERVPIFEQKTAGITRDYDTLRTRYTSLLDKKLSADTASAMESRQKSERFVMLSPAQVPEKPFSPNRPLLLLGGLVVGLLVGIGAAMVRDMSDETVRDSREAEKILGKPVLSGVPEILTAKEQWRNRLTLGAAGVATVMVALVTGMGIAHLSVRFF
jgi:polysaccharide chain length determinant protein (PEP-CTERM system associated)